MTSNSEYHGYEIPDDGEQNWGDPLQRTLQALDRDTVIRRATASDIRDETPTNDALGITRDSERVFIGTDTAWLELDTLGPDPEVTSLDADENLSLPVRTDNSTVTAEDGQVWFNDGSGPDAAGVYYYDANSQIVGPVGEGAGSAPASLSGLQIDTTKDFDGFSLEGLGHDEVDVPQTRNLTVADFEGGVLPDAYGVDRGSFAVQSSVVDTGKFALKGEEISDGGAQDIQAVEPAKSAPQLGDTFRYSVQLTGGGDVTQTFVLTQSETFFERNLSLRVRSDLDRIGIANENSTTNTANAPISSRLNEWLSVEVELGLDGSVTMTLFDAGGAELATTTNTTTLESGGIGFRLFSNNNESAVAYWDSLTVDRRVGEYYSNTQNGTVELGNDVQPSGAIDTGPQEAIVSDSTVHGILRSDDDLSAGDDIEVVEWDAGVGRRSLKGQADGNGGVYGLRSPLAERVTQQLSFESESLSDTTFRTQFGTTSHSASLSGFPRQLTVSHDGSDSGRGGLKSSVVTTHDSLAPFRVTFRQVDFSNNNDDNELILAIHTGDADTDLINLNTGVAFKSGQSGQGQDDFSVVQSGTRTRDATAGGKIPWDTARDISFEVDASQTRLLVDGELRSTLDVSPDGLLTPVIQLVDDGGNTTNETVSVEQITVEEL